MSWAAMAAGGPVGSAPPLVPLATFLVLLGLERARELRLSRRNAARMASRGGTEHAARHFPLMVTLHALFPGALAAEVLWLGARPPQLWPLWLGALAAAQGLRWWAITSLGDRWNVRIWTVPGEPLVHRGPYRFLRHPNYVAVAVEFVAAPLLFGAWRTALVFSALDAALLAVRIRAEERALGLRRSAGASPSARVSA